MAIDTETYRRSLVPLYAIHVVGQLPDGLYSEGDRAHTVNLYSGRDYQSSGVTARKRWFGDDFYRTEYR